MPGPPPPPPPPEGRRLLRSSQDRLLAGIAGGLGRHFDLDPALVRIAFVVLALFGGAGVALYVILWLILPSDTRPARIGRDSPRSHQIVLAMLLLLVVVSLPFTGPGFLFAGPALLVVAVVGALGVLLWRAVGGEGPPTLTRLALAVLAITGAVLLGLGAGVAAAFGAGTAMAIVVVVAGLALVVGGFLGGARWLIVPAIAMAIPVAVVSAADIDLKGGVGQRDQRPSSIADLEQHYRLGVGELQLDLRNVDFPPGRTDLDVHVGLGRTEVLVPEDVCVQTDVRVGAGEVVRFGRSDDGIDVRVASTPLAKGDAPILALDADAGVGQVVVGHRPSRDWHGAGGFAEAPDGQAACTG
jgi:phage shock protein PspC (stress-responsive transcriptional regulator)/predicted membrane protein